MDWNDLSTMGREALGIGYRTIVLYFVTLLVVRMMGKRSVANLAPFDLAVIIIAGSAAALPMEEERIGMIHGIVPLLLLGALQLIVSWVNLKWRTAEKITQGIGTLLVKNGQVIEENLRRERITMTDLTIILREKGVDHIADVQEARIEPTGNYSVILKAEARPVTPRDLDERGLSQLNGIIDQNLSRLRQELLEALARNDQATTGKPP
ncbi:MAG: YetF domain-containing protein [Bacillota bacterium]